MTTTPPHVIFGTGAIGLATLDALRSRGETIRLVNRSGHAPVADDVEVVAGDAADPTFTTRANLTDHHADHDRSLACCGW